jgi:hypothetical protein
LRYSVILFWRFFAPRRLSGLMFSDEHPSHARARAFLDEIGKLVAERIHLDDEADIELLGLAQVYQAVEDPLPVLVAGKIVVGDEETAHAFGVIEAHDLLDIGGRAVP